MRNFENLAKLWSKEILSPEDSLMILGGDSEQTVVNNCVCNGNNCSCGGRANNCNCSSASTANNCACGYPPIENPGIGVKPVFP